MHVTALIAERTPPPRLTIRSPSWEQALAAINSLDGKGQTTLVLEHSDEDYMTVGGGGQLFMCEIYKESEPGEFRSWQLCDPDSESEEPIKMVVGVEIFVPRRNCVTINTVAQAAQVYYQHGIADPALEWETS